MRLLFIFIFSLFTGIHWDSIWIFPIFFYIILKNTFKYQILLNDGFLTLKPHTKIIFCFNFKYVNLLFSWPTKIIDWVFYAYRKFNKSYFLFISLMNVIILYYFYHLFVNFYDLCYFDWENNLKVKETIYHLQQFFNFDYCN